MPYKPDTAAAAGLSFRIASYYFVIHYHICTTFYASFTTFYNAHGVHETMPVNISATIVFGLYMRKMPPCGNKTAKDNENCYKMNYFVHML